MELNQRLWELWQVQEEDRDAAVKVLTTIFGNIAKDPNNAKYRDLNFSKIRKKFEKAKPAFYLMYSAGFGQNVDGSRLVLGLADIKMFHKANESLMKKIANPDDPSLVPASQKAKEPKSGIKDKHFKEKYASSSQAKHEREAREEKEAIERQNSHLNEDNDNENNNNNNNNNENDENNDSEMGDGSDAPKKVDTRSTEEIEKDNSDVKNALDGLDADDMDLLAQIQSSKDTTVSLSMAELVGKTKEEKIAIFKDKQKQFRKEKAQVERRTQIDREKKRRENVKLAQEAKLKREEQQRAMVARKKQREKQEEKMRKQRIREKIQADKERKQKQKEWEEKRKQEQQQQAPQ